MTVDSREPRDTTPQIQDEFEAVTLRVSTVIDDLDRWLSGAKRLFSGPIDITFMALGTVLIAVAIWARVLNPKTWSAPEFLGLLLLAAIAFMVAFAERVLVEYGRHQEAELKRIREELDALRYIHAELEKSLGSGFSGHRSHRSALSRFMRGN